MAQKIAKVLQIVKVLVNWGTFGEKKIQKSLTMPKKLKGDPLVPPGNVCYAEIKEEPSYFSSLGQIVQFDTLNFRRTL